MCRMLTHWFAIRLWVTGTLILLIAYFLWISPNTYGDIIEKKELRVGYLKFPDNGYTYNDEAYGYELKVLEKFADDNELTLSLEKFSLENMSQALNINKIDIGIGGLSENIIDPNLNEVTQPWDHQTLCIVEYRAEGSKPNFDTDSEENIIFVGRRLSSPRLLEMLRTNIPNSTFLSRVEEERALIEKLEKSEIKYAVTTLGRLRIIQSMFPNIRRVHTFKEEHENFVWMLPKRADKALIHDLNLFLENKDTLIFKRNLSQNLFKKPKHFHYLDSLTIKKHIDSRLPEYEQWFKLAAKEYDLDWTLLAALAYQESKWKVDAVSPTKVRGIMQITTSTAKSLGIDNRLDAFSTIFAGAKYLDGLRKRIPKRVQEPDRTRMALGAYNIGFGYILSAYKDARRGNLQTVTWEDIEDRLPTIHKSVQYDHIDNGSATFARGYQAIKYVSRIEEFDQILRYYAAD